MAQEQGEVTAKDRFDTLDSDRGSTLDRAVLCSELTLPYLFMEEGSSAQDDLSREYVQGYGAKLVNNLVGKFALTILPPSQPFFRLSSTEEAMEIVTEGSEDKATEAEKVLSMKEKQILRYINRTGFRRALYPALRLSVVTGDALIEILEEDSYRVFNMYNYVIKRDGSGKVVELVIMELLSKDTLPEGIELKDADSYSEEDEIELYTRVYYSDGKYIMYQELEDEVVGTEQTFDDLSDRFINLPFTLVLGEDYGRAYVEEHLGTFLSLNKQLKVINESSVVNSKTIFTVNPNGMTKYRDFVEAKNGRAIIGNEQDIGVIRTNKQSDMQITYQLVQDYKKELAEAFLLGGATIRDAERVTAREIQLIANELETSFGGIHTYMASSVQLPIVNNSMKKLGIEKGKDIEVVITVGIDALGRSLELSRLNNMVQELAGLGQVIGQDEVKMYVNTGNVVASIVNNSGVAGNNYVKTKKEVDSILSQQQQNNVEEKIVEGGANALGSNLVNGTMQ